MSAGDSERAEWADRLDAPFWVKAWYWMVDRYWYDNTGMTLDREEEAPRRWRFDRLRRLPNKQDGQSG